MFVSDNKSGKIIIDAGGNNSLAAVKPMEDVYCIQCNAWRSGPSSHSMYLFVVGNELCLHVAGHQVDPAQHLSRLQTPDGAGGVDAGGTCTDDKAEMKKLSPSGH